MADRDPEARRPGRPRRLHEGRIAKPHHLAAHDPRRVLPIGDAEHRLEHDEVAAEDRHGEQGDQGEGHRDLNIDEARG